MTNKPRYTIHNAIFTLKVMVWKSNNENSRSVSDRTRIRYHYLERLKDILVSSNQNLTNQILILFR